MSKIRIVVYSIIILLCIAILVPEYKVDPILEPYHEDFMLYINSYCKSSQYFHPHKIKIQFKKIEGPVIGECTQKFFEYDIDIDKDYWDKSNEDVRYQLMFHELTHCVINQNHVPDEQHYMAEYMYPLSKQEVRNQLVKILEEICK